MTFDGESLLNSSSTLRDNVWIVEARPLREGVSSATLGRDEELAVFLRFGAGVGESSLLRLPEVRESGICGRIKGKVF